MIKISKAERDGINKGIDMVRDRLRSNRDKIPEIALSIHISQSALNEFARNNLRVPRADNLALIKLALDKLEDEK